MSEDNEKQADALIAALAPKIAEAILPQIAESVEKQIEGISAKNDELLDKLVKEKEHRKRLDTSQALADSAEADMAERLRGTFNAADATKPVQLSRADARNVQFYRAAKTEAEKRGVSLQIVEDD